MRHTAPVSFCFEAWRDVGYGTDRHPYDRVRRVGSHRKLECTPQAGGVDCGCWSSGANAEIRWVEWKSRLPSGSLETLLSYLKSISGLCYTFLLVRELMNRKPVSDLALRLSAVDQFQTTLVLKHDLER